MDFYYVPVSAQCRSMLMTADLVGMELNKKLMNLKNGEQLKPEFLELNPQHTVPKLVDNGFVLCESRAILCYLVEAYAKNDSLYPKCAKKRAVINQSTIDAANIDLKKFTNVAKWLQPEAGGAWIVRKLGGLLGLEEVLELMVEK